MRIQTGDVVVVIAGADRGVQAKVIRVDRKAGKAIVEGVGRVYKHVRPSQKHPQGGRLSKEMPISVSNLMLVCPETGKRTRIGYRFRADGVKERYAKASGVALGEVSGPRRA